jgi:TM2 domain-containing protein/RING finger family protein
MSGAVCPYCRTAINPDDGEVLCEGCSTPHHGDCYAENGGCTVFGCRCAPAEEPKVAVSAPELASAAAASADHGFPAAPPMVTSPLSAINAPVASTAGAVPSFSLPLGDSAEGKNKMTFVMLGLFLGALGGHNFYAGYRGKAVLQLCMSVLTLGIGAPMAWIWAVIEICIVNTDSKGVQFRS